MLLYHGSPHKVESLEKHQAETAEGGTAPEGELLDAIYFTPDHGLAVAMAVRPEGSTWIDGGQKTIKFEHPELFDPEMAIFIYEIDSERIPAENLRRVDDNQFAVVGLDALRPGSMKESKAGEVLDYYRILNWEPKEGQEAARQRR